MIVPFYRLVVVMQAQVGTDCHSSQQATEGTVTGEFACSFFVIADIAHRSCFLLKYLKYSQLELLLLKKKKSLDNG